MDHTTYPGIDYSYEKDTRFDGHFFRAIVTTGIFCRPLCPSRPARAENVLFFSTAAAAAEAGFRPCLRCRPESAPDRPDGIGVSRLVQQALHLISEGSEGDELARRVHLSPRQLRRQFVAELGAPPVAIIQTRRLLFAKKLIDETKLPMTEVAFSAGYSSIRRFNDAIQQTYARTPTELRQSRRNGRANQPTDSITLKLFYRPPYNWTAMFNHLRQWAIPGVELVTTEQYRRTVRFGNDFGLITATPFSADNYLLLQVPYTLARHLLLITERLKQLFDLRTDSAFIEQHLVQCPCLAEAIGAYPGLRMPGTWDKFEGCVRMVLRHHFDTQTAMVWASKIAVAYGKPLLVPSETGLTHLFPEPDQALTDSLASLRLPPAAAETIVAIAQMLTDDPDQWYEGETVAARVGMLQTLPHVTPQLAYLLAMYVMGECDAFPAGDLPDQCHADEAELWRPWRAYGSQWLWLGKNGRYL